MPHPRTNNHLLRIRPLHIVQRALLILQIPLLSPTIPKEANFRPVLLVSECLLQKGALTHFPPHSLPQEQIN